MVLDVPTIDGIVADEPTIYLYERSEHDRISGLNPPTDQRVWSVPVRETEG
jgi:hypothetical protein